MRENACWEGLQLNVNVCRSAVIDCVTCRLTLMRSGADHTKAAQNPSHKRMSMMREKGNAAATNVRKENSPSCGQN